MEQVLNLEDMIAEESKRYRYMQQCVVLGRGYNYSSAYEWALKLKELTYISAEAYSSADFMHGPIAMINGGFPVLAVVPKGHVYSTMLETISLLKHKLHAELVTISNADEALKLAETPIQLAPDIPEWLTVITSYSIHYTKLYEN